MASGTGIIGHVTTLRNWIEPGTLRAGWVAWAVFAAVMAALAARDGSQSVTGNYRVAAEAWVSARTMYHEGGDGWLYLPQSAQLFVPFTLVPDALGEALWRVFCIALLAIGVRSATRALTPSDEPGRPPVDLFFLTTLLVIPASLGSAQNGQTNLPLGACIALACAAYARGRPGACAAWCAAGLLFKPLMIVPILLLTALWFRRLAIPMAAALGVYALLPFVHADWSYVTREYASGLAKVREASAFADRPFADLVGMLAKTGLVDGREFTTSALMTLVRGAAAALTLTVCALAAGRGGRQWGGVAVLTLGAAYLMLMNPRTEGVSYCIVAIPAAIWCAMALMQRRIGLAWPMAGVMFILAFAHEIARPITHESKDFVLRPLATIVMLLLTLPPLLTRRGDAFVRADSRTE